MVAKCILRVVDDVRAVCAACCRGLVAIRERVAPRILSKPDSLIRLPLPSPSCMPYIVDTHSN